LFIVTAKKLTLRNIKNFLKENGFPAADADKLGEQLDGVTAGDISTFKRNNHGNWEGIFTSIIDQWLNNDVDQSWEKLAQALSACGYEVISKKILGPSQVPEKQEDSHFHRKIPNESGI